MNKTKKSHITIEPLRAACMYMCITYVWNCLHVLVKILCLIQCFFVRNDTIGQHWFRNFILLIYLFVICYAHNCEIITITITITKTQMTKSIQLSTNQFGYNSQLSWLEVANYESEAKVFKDLKNSGDSTKLEGRSILKQFFRMGLYATYFPTCVYELLAYFYYIIIMLNILNI